MSLGQKVTVSDLYAMGFDPAEAAGHYPSVHAGMPFDVLKTQEAAAHNGTLPQIVNDEIARIRAADRLIFHFPLWWFAPPAMIKGWCERVLANGALHSTAARFDTGQCQGKSALFCVTTGSDAAESAYNGKEGDVALHLWPLAYTLRYLGLDVLAPKIIHGVHGYHRGDAQSGLETRLGTELTRHAQTIAKYDDLPRMTFNADGDFDDQGLLRSDAVSHSPFIRKAQNHWP